MNATLRKIYLNFIPQNLSIFFAVTLFLTYGCSNDYNVVSNDKAIAAYSKPSTVNFIGHWFNEGNKEDFLNDLVNEFEFLNQDVDVIMRFPEDLYFDRKIDNVEFIFNANMVLMEKPEWDIIRLNNECAKVGTILKDQDWPRKYLVDFSQIPEFRENIRPELLTEEYKTQFGGILPGPLIDGYNWILWYNSDLAKKIGIEIKQFDMTNEDFVGYLKAVDDYNKRNNTDIIGIYDSGNWKTAHTLAEMLFFSEIGSYSEIMDMSYSDEKIAAWNKVLNELERWSQYNPMAKNWSTTTWTETTNYPIDQKCLFYCNASWMYNIWLKADSTKTKNMVPAELPVYKPSPLCYGGYQAVWAVLKNAPNKDEAIRLMLAINQTDVAERWSRYTKSPTGIKGRLTTNVFGFDKFENYQYNIDKKFGNKKVPVIYNTSFCLGKNNSTLPNYTEEVLSGTMTAKEAMSRIKRSIGL